MEKQTCRLTEELAYRWNALYQHNMCESHHNVSGVESRTSASFVRDFHSCSKTEDIKSASQQIALGQGGNGSPTTTQQIEPKECLTNVQHDSASLRISTVLKPINTIPNQLRSAFTESVLAFSHAHRNHGHTKFLADKVAARGPGHFYLHAQASLSRSEYTRILYSILSSERVTKYKCIYMYMHHSLIPRPS